jgi:hypothetical protein
VRTTRQAHTHSFFNPSFHTLSIPVSTFNSTSNFTNTIRLISLVGKFADLQSSSWGNFHYIGACVNLGFREWKYLDVASRCTPGECIIELSIKKHGRTEVQSHILYLYRLSL